MKTKLTVGQKRLLKLADYLETVPRKLFNMDCWGVERTCGTTGCALVHACFIPSFRRAGLRFLENELYDNEPQYYFVEYKGLGNEYAAQSFFELNYAETTHIFYNYGEGNPTPKQWAKRIRTFVEKGLPQ